MRTIGLIGGMSWQASAEYYRLINEAAAARLGGQHNAKSVMLTVDFDEIVAFQQAGDWEGAAKTLAEAATSLERAGADMVALCANTMHVVAEPVAAAITVPFVHLVDVTADAVKATGITRVGLLGTRYTMEMDFYKDRMAELGVEVLVPPAEVRTAVHDIIYGELTFGILREESREVFRRGMANLAERGAAGIIFGCTEIPLLVSAADSPVPVFDSTLLHAERLVGLAVD